MNQNVITIPATRISPSVLIDKEQFLIQITGDSYPEDPNDIYRDVIDWIDSLGNKIDKPLTCEFYFTFLNSSSHKMVFDIMMQLQNLHNNGSTVRIFWFYAEDDEDIMEKGEDFIDVIGVPIEIQPK